MGASDFTSRIFFVTHQTFAVLSEDEDGYGLESSAKLDPSLLVEQRDNVSDAPLLGVVDAPRLTSQMQQGR